MEPVHAVFWYAPEVFAEAAALGYEVTTRWPSYFAWRLAPRAWARLAASACYSFSPAVVTAHVLPRGRWPRRRRSWRRASGRSTGCTGRCWAT